MEYQGQKYNISHCAVKLCGLGNTRQKMACNPETNINTFFCFMSGSGYRWTLLGYGAMKDDVELVRACLEGGADPQLGSLWYENGAISSMSNALVLARSAKEHFKEIVDLLLDAKIIPTPDDIYKMFEGSISPLNLECMKWCLDNGADVRCSTIFTGSPLIYLSYKWNTERNKEYTEAAALLIHKEVDRSIEWKSPFKFGIWEAHLDLYPYLVKDQEEQRVRIIEEVNRKVATLVCN